MELLGHDHGCHTNNSTQPSAFGREEAVLLVLPQRTLLACVAKESLPYGTGLSMGFDTQPVGVDDGLIN